MSLVISFDPGVSGALVIDQNGVLTVIDAEDYTFKTEKKVTAGKRKGKMSNTSHYDLKKLADLIPSGPGVIVIENVSRMPTDSAHASTLLIEGKSFARGIAAARGLDEILVTPSSWKRKMKLPKGATKEDSRQMALTQFPELADQMTLKKHENKAEALLILKYYKDFILNAPPKKPKRVKKKI